MLFHLRKSYADVAVLLGIEEREVRQHAQSALVELAPQESSCLAPELREPLGDYLLGQRSHPSGWANCDDGDLDCYRARAWAQAVNEGLVELLDLAPFELHLFPGRDAPPASALAAGGDETVAIPASRGLETGRLLSRRVTPIAVTVPAVIVGICAA
jgi:hypothetical protein